MIVQGFKLEAVGDDAEKASSAGTADRCLRYRAHMLMSCRSAAPLECNEDEVDLSNWNSSEDAYTFLYNPDLWQQGGKLFVLPPHDGIALSQSVQISIYLSCRGHSSYYAQDSEPGGPAAVELGQLESS